MGRKQELVYFGSSTSSVLRGSSGIGEGLHPSFAVRGICRDEPLTQSGKRIQLIKMLCLNVLPILGLWAYTVYTLADSIGFREEYYKRRSSLYFSIDLGKLVHRLQVERDMSVLYLSAIGPDTKSFLLKEYSNTDNILQKLNWASDIDDITQNVKFTSKEEFQNYLNEHRRRLSPNDGSIQDEIDFYSKSIDVIILWLYNTITESKFSFVWKLLVAYQKLSSAKENLGVERALGTMFYARGGFETQEYFENYNRRLHSFRAYMKSIGMYSNEVDTIYLQKKEDFPSDFLSIVDTYRDSIQTSTANMTVPDVQKARFFFDNMTIYIDILFETQSTMASFLISKFNTEIDSLTMSLVINAVLLVIVILICPVVIVGTESLTSSIQTYALTLVDKTKELTNEKKRTDGLLYQMVPKQVADMLKRKKKVDAEFYKLVTVCFADVYEFDKFTVDLAPMEIVEFLNSLYNTVDDILDSYDIYKVETINDCYMVASGLPRRNKDRHAYEIAEFTLTMLNKVSSMKFLSGTKSIQLRIGVNSGPCMAGIVGSIMPRYCLFGDTVNTASRMKAYSEPNMIHISHSAHQLLKKFKSFIIKKRGSVTVKGKGDMRTYWLVGRLDEMTGRPDTMMETHQQLPTTPDLPGAPTEITTDNYASVSHTATGTCTSGNWVNDGYQAYDPDEFPGEIKTIESPTYSAALQYPIPGRPQNRRKTIMKQSQVKNDENPDIKDSK